MRKFDDKKSSGRRFAVSVLIGAGFGFLVTVFLFAGFAALIAAGTLSDSLMGHVVVVSALLGSAVGSMVAAGRYRGKILPISLAVAALMFFITLIGSASSEKGRVFGGMTPLMLASLFAGAVAGSLLNAKKKRRSS